MLEPSEQVCGPDEVEAYEASHGGLIGYRVWVLLQRPGEAKGQKRKTITWPTKAILRLLSS